MKKKVLNVAAGLLPMAADDFSVDCEVLNYDPLTSVKNVLDGVMLGIFAGMVSEPEPLFNYSHSANFYSTLTPKSLDLIIGVSPHGFSLIDADTDRCLKVGGIVLITGNKKNKYILAKNSFASTALENNYSPTEAPDNWILKMGEKILLHYPSHTSALERDTKLETLIFYKKNKESAAAAVAEEEQKGP
jgi:hypothetical protein